MWCKCASLEGREDVRCDHGRRCGSLDNTSLISDTAVVPYNRCAHPRCGNRNRRGMDMRPDVRRYEELFWDFGFSKVSDTLVELYAL